MATSLPGAIPSIPEINPNSMAAQTTHTATYYRIWEEFRALCTLVFGLNTRLSAREVGTVRWVIRSQTGGTTISLLGDSYPGLRACWAKGTDGSGKSAIVPLSVSSLIDGSAVFFWRVTLPAGGPWDLYLEGGNT